MNKNIEILFDHDLNSPDSRSGFDTPELNKLYKQLETSNHEEKDSFEVLLNKFQRAAQKAAFERGFYTAIDIIMDGGSKYGE